MQTKISYRFQATDLMVALGVLSILAGSLLSAGMAHEPSRFAMWASAYLVLAAGLVQVALGLLLRNLALKDMERNLYVSTVLYNIGGLGVIAGTALKATLVGPTVLVLAGTILLLSIVIIAYGVRQLRRSPLLAALYALLAIIFLSTLVGLFLSTIIRLS